MSDASSDLDARLRRRLQHAARRLCVTRGWRRGVWLVLGAVWAAELAFLTTGALALGAGVLALGLVGAALAQLKPVDPLLAAAVADARLGGGAVSSGAEALAGGHSRFGGLATREAWAAAEALPLARWAPWQAPAGWPLGVLVSALLPLALVSQATSAEAGTSRRLPGLLDPAQVASAGGGASSDLDTGAIGFAEDLAGVPWTDLAPEVAAALGEDLKNAGAATPGGGEGEESSDGGSGGRAEAGSGSLSAYAAELRAAAAAGDAAAQATLEALERQLGAGAGATPSQPGALADPDPEATIRLETPRREQVRWDLQTAERRYFTRQPTGR